VIIWAAGTARFRKGKKYENKQADKYSWDDNGCAGDGCIINEH
jgi:hypothetical protein